MSKRNPKQEGSNVYDCRVQTGPCPNKCNQCFYNRPGAYYEDINKPHDPVSHLRFKGAIVRMNCGHDSNIEREKVIEESRSYDDVFFNTSIPKFDFPGPVVFTANAQEESSAHYIMSANMMFVRLRVSATNLDFIEDAVRYYTGGRKPVVLTFMAYYDGDPPGCVKRDDGCWFKNPVNNRIGKLIYTWKKRHINSYWCPTPVFIRSVLRDMNKIGGRLVTMCGTPDSPWCRDCRNCETYYWQTKRYMKEQANA